MYLANNILLLEMPKAGSTFMRRFMDNYFGGDKISKIGVHNGIADEHVKKRILNGELHVINTIRNPLDWYVSLFAWNSNGQGIYKHIGLNRYDMNIEGFKTVLRNPLVLFRNLENWKGVFADSKSKELFTTYIYLLLNKHPHHVDVGFGKVADSLGYMTYRFLELNTFDFKQCRSKIISTSSDINQFYSENKVPVNFLRLEHIQTDLLAISSKIGLDENKTREVLNKLENNNKVYNSTDRETWEYYYTEHNKQLIQKKDSLIYDLFGYNKM